MDFANKLKIARKAIGYTQEKVEQQTGIGKSSLSAFEKGEREPKFSQLAQLAEVYKKSVEFFLSDEAIVKPVMLWREVPSSEEEKKLIEAEFNKLCEQYHKLEIITGQVRNVKLPQPDVDNPKDFTFGQSEAFAGKVQRELCLGDIPSSSLKKVLEEKFLVKIFHLKFSGSSISTYSPVYEYAVLLNSDQRTKQWRRNYDLAHELFHLCTMNLFKSDRTTENQPMEMEEKFANAFASKLLLPTDIVKERIEKAKDKNGRVNYEALYEIAREFGVSTDALLWRMVYLYNKTTEEIENLIKEIKELEANRPSRFSDEPEKLPERYCRLAITALNEGKLSLMQFAKYMDISYKQAQEYLIEDKDFTDEKISISVA